MKKPKKKGGKKRTKPVNPDALDRRVLAAVVAVGLLLVGGAGYMAYDMFLKPPSVVGVWKGSMVEHEIGRSLSHTQYALTLDDAARANLSINASSFSGTYRVKGNRLVLALKDEDGIGYDREYRIRLGRATMGLMEPGSDTLLVDLVRQLRTPAADRASQAAAAKDLVDDGDRAADPDVDASLASREFVAKDGAFKLRHPTGWKPHTGGRPDNTYSYIHVEKDPFKISAYADTTGSLISGSDSTNPGDFPEGSEFAPVHKAHEHFTKTGVHEFTDYQEGKPDLFKDSGMGEGRIAVFTASAGIFGGKLKGYHATMLTRDRRISVLIYGPEEDFARLRPTYLAVCRSVSQ